MALHSSLGRYDIELLRVQALVDKAVWEIVRAKVSRFFA